MTRITFILIAMFLLALNGISQTISVPGDQPSIQAAIDAASNGDTILVEEDSYYENIDFKGKPITVASRFILDGDTSHISRTIINGNKSDDPDYASVVTMRSGEDTTSILMGFTITGGSGTYVTQVFADHPDYVYFAGGGILIYNSGGKIIHNIVEENHISAPENMVNGAIGCGILAAVNHNHTAIIRGNLIRNNSGTGHYAWGGGIGLHGGRCIAENNIIRDNVLDSAHIAGGGGIFFEDELQPGTIEETIIRNNRISGNTAISYDDWGLGGGIALASPYLDVLVYNNLIYRNQAQYGGGFWAWKNSCKAYNNTILNNESLIGGNNVYVDNETQMTLINNIIWSDTPKEVEEIGFWDASNSSLRLFHNILSESINPTYPVSKEGNSYLDPELDSGTFELGPSSPAVGRGIDTMWIGSEWFVAPARDINGFLRPADADQSVDIGAFESEYERPVLANADLFSVGMVGHSLDPPFHKDTLAYLLVRNPGTKKTGNWQILAADDLATMEIDTAADLMSENELDRTTTILVTAMNGTNQKEYKVVYKFLSSDATLASLEVSLGSLVPNFDPLVTEYFDTIPYGIRIPVPELTYIASDSSSTVEIKPAQDIYNRFEVFRTTTVYVTSPNNLFTKEYTVLFTVDLTRPELRLFQDSVEIGKEIGVTVSEADQVYLVPANTAGIYDSIVPVALEMVDAENTDTVYISTERLDSTGTFWLYACNRYKSISENLAVTIYSASTFTRFLSEDIRIYPTPVSKTLYFDSPHPMKSAEVYDILGKQILITIEPEGRIELGHLNAGIYMVRLVFDEDKNYITRIIKN